MPVKPSFRTNIYESVGPAKTQVSKEREHHEVVAYIGDGKEEKPTGAPQDQQLQEATATIGWVG